MLLAIGAANFSSALSRAFGWRPAMAAALLGIIATLPPAATFAQQTRSGKPGGDWPCRQILVDKISLPAVWAGPSIEGTNWRSDAAIADLVAQLAARRVPIEAAERAITEFARSKGTEKAPQLIALFAGLYETLNRERTQVIDGLNRLGHRQKELAAKIRSENAAIQAGADAASPNIAARGTAPTSETLEWDLRVFDERRQSLTYVCETPTLIEQRLFALAKVIQQNLD